MHEPVWAQGLGWCWGLGPVDLADDTVALPESVEDQTRKILSNLDALLAAHGLTRTHVVAVRIHLTQFTRLEKRMLKALSGAFEEGSGPSISHIGVSHLPRDALIAMDFVIRAA